MLIMQKQCICGGRCMWGQVGREVHVRGQVHVWGQVHVGNLCCLLSFVVNPKPPLKYEFLFKKGERNQSSEQTLKIYIAQNIIPCSRRGRERAWGGRAANSMTRMRGSWRRGGSGKVTVMDLSHEL